MKKNYVKEVEMNKSVVSAYKSQDFAQSQKFFAWSHNRETVTFRNSGYRATEIKFWISGTKFSLSIQKLSCIIGKVSHTNL